MAASIKKLDVDSVRSLNAGQIVVSLELAVKELVENALDSGAQSIEVKLYDYGCTNIEVIDDGHGIDDDMFGYICKFLS